jgi:hypothetical protein
VKVRVAQDVRVAQAVRVTLASSQAAGRVAARRKMIFGKGVCMHAIPGAGMGMDFFRATPKHKQSHSNNLITLGAHLDETQP